MKFNLTKPSAIFLLLLTTTPYFCFFIHEAAQKAVRHEMEERLEKENLQTVRIPVTEINWAKEGKEIWVLDRLFDIKSIRLSGDQYILTGLFDDEETALVKNLIKDQQKQDAGGNKLMASFFHLFTYTGTDPIEASDIPGLTKNRYAELFVTILTRQPAVHAPPPRS